jgi:hypothetical protein
MAYYPIQGSKFFVQNAIAAPVNVTNITNAAPPVVSAAAHGLVDTDEALMLVGWEDFNASVFRVDQIDSGSFELDGYSSLNTTWYPQGSDTGTVQKITGWAEIGQVLGLQGGGGAVRNVTVQPFDRRTPVNIPVGFEASNLSFTLGYDPALAAQIELALAGRQLLKRAIKFALPGGGFAYCYGTVGFNPIPNFNPQGVLEANIAITIDGLFTFYTA